MSEATKQYLRALAEWYSKAIEHALDPAASATDDSGNNGPPPPPPTVPTAG